ncbi:MAG: cell division protein ZipA [Paraperlucidibaca sp.]|jgi:cell division protein ZipA|nr:cell division protein ZipA [Paraperlucidibaca sp.]MBQ0842165.1 cell division protein ZipA [Paraperlucidibaca sp.]
MNTQWVQYLIAALVVAVIIYLWRKRANRLSLRIERVSPERLDNTPIERNEIVGEVRVRAREQAAAAALAAEQSRIEPTIDRAPAVAEAVVKAAPEVVLEPMAEPVSSEVEAAVTEAKPVSEEPTEAEALTFYPGFQDGTGPAAAIIENEEPPVAALTQDDLFPEAADDSPSLGGIDESELAFDRVISIHVMAREDGIPGRLLLEHLLQYGLRYGDMAIFHRHEHPTGQGAILFSLAQAMEPGTFDIDTLSRDNVPGVSLFLGLPGYKCLVAYDLMIDTARRLSSALQADMLDDQGQILTAGKLADWRDEVVAIESRSPSA